MSTGGAKPFLWFGCADGTLTRAEVATPRARLARELQPILGWMGKCDIEKPNEPVVVLFSRLPTDVVRSGTVLPGRGGGTQEETAGTSALGDVSVTEQLRVQALRRAIDEARAKLNPRFMILVSVSQPWLWTFVFLRSHDHLRPALHRLAPAATQLVADRPMLPMPTLLVLDDLTPGQNVVQRLRSRIAQELRPMLLWMGEEDTEGPNERVVVLFTCTDVNMLAQRFVVATVDPGALPAGTAAPMSPGIADLSDADMQRMFLARDRLMDVIDTLQPRLLALVNWLKPEQWVAVLCRNHTRLVSGMAKMLPSRAFYVWAPRRLAQPKDTVIVDICYSNTCPKRGQVQEGVRFCPKCLTAKYCCVACQNDHWRAGHCRFCERLQEARLKREPPAKSGGTNVRSSVTSFKGGR